MMDKRVENVARKLAAGVAGAILAGTLLAPRGAFALPRTNPITGDTDPVIVEPQPDLRLELFQVTDMGGDNWKLRATVRNGPAGGSSLIDAYPGGGSLVISRSKGGTSVVEPPSPNYPAIPDPVTVLKQVPIPALASGQAMSAEVITHGKAVFTARAASLAGFDSNLSNNSKTVSKLLSFSFTVDNTLLHAFLNPIVDTFQAHLNRKDSFVRLPGYFERFFDIPDATKGLFPFVTAHWYVNDINLTDTRVDLASRSLSVSFNFETNGDEIVGFVDNGPDFLAPNINASPLQINIKLPLGYNSVAQCFFYGTPQVSVNAHWDLNNLPDFLLPDINGKISDAIKKLLSETTVKQRLEFELNKQIHARLNGGRIASALINDSDVQMTVEFGG